MFDENYSKPYHISGSPTVFLDLDTLLYLLLISFIVWLVVRSVQKRRKRKQISYTSFMSRYLLACSVPLFLGNLITLLLFGKMVLANWIICFLSLIYAGVLQLLFWGMENKQGQRKYVIIAMLVVVGLVWYHLPISLSYQYEAVDSNGEVVKICVSGKVYKYIFLQNKKDMVLTIDSARIHEIPFCVTEDSFVTEDDIAIYSQEGTIQGVNYHLRISDNQSIIEYEESAEDYCYSLYKTGRWIDK